MSDVAAATTPNVGAVTTEDAFQSFYDNGGMDDRPEDQSAQGGAAAPQGQDAAQESAQTSQQADPAAQAQDDNTPTYASLNELLTAHKIDPQSVMGLHVTAKIDGQEKAVPLSEVLASFQLQGHVNNKSIELSNQRTAFEQERQAVRTLAQQQLQQNQALGNLAQQMLNHDFQRIDWNGLRANNPAEFAALQAEFQQRQQGIQQYMGQLQQQAHHEEQQRQQALQQSVAAENERLMNLRPEWRDQAAFTKDRQQMTQYARSLGFQDAELGQIFDHRYMLILHDAARYQALQAATPQALKQVRQAPQMVAPGSRTDVSPREAQRKSVVERLNRNPRDQDAQAAAFEFFANQ
ncbi:hypothetical protein [Paraburkholderia bannensis]|uniref:hypothetical protein n=1 Tax=Paraburkholderia bannensis TaxID=765414 RepID=UPI002AB5FBAB|nr:hypothetical protein [Paraburkholderia bannensis]